MFSSRIRGALVLFAASALVSLGAPVSAAAAEKSQITVPSGPASVLVEPGGKLAVQGTAEGVAEVEIRCFRGPGEFESSTLAGKVPVTGGKFEVEAPTSSLFVSPCQLRAVPQGAGAKLTGQGPGSKTEFEGPLLAVSYFENVEEGANFYAVSGTVAGGFYFESAGHYAIESTLFSAVAHKDPYFFYGDADLRSKPPVGSRSTVQVDGANAYVPYAALEIERELSNEAGKPVKLEGKPSVTVTKEFNEATRQITLHELDPVVRCSPSNEYPPTFKGGGCTSFAPTGVTLVRTWQTSNEDHVAWLADRWQSTDGAGHNVNLRYYTEMTGTNAEGDVFKFPGEGGFAATNTGESKTLPGGPGIVQIKSTPGVPDGGDGENPQGAIAYDAAPSEPIAVTKGSSKTKVSVFEMPYHWSVPAGGSSPTLRMAFTQSFALPEALALAEGAIASYYPTVSIGSPANGSTTSSAAVSVTGSASDGVGLSSLTVNGKAVSVGAGGAWSTSVALSPGANTITATATNQSGLSRSASVTVTYKPSPPAPATAALVGKARVLNGGVTFTVVCNGAPGTSCKVHATLTTLEKLRRGRMIGLTAAKIRTKRVTVASVTVVIPAGQSVKLTLKPNATGRKLLARFHRLPVRLTATLEGPAGSSAFIVQNLTIKPKPKKKKHHKH